ncbi:MAG: FAD-dependent oxidoreductase [Rubrivivax sp.]|nr:FAD-dependent oxidoreductase [Rubrivivax sp.]
MHQSFSYPRFEYRQPPELQAPGAAPRRYPLVIVGAGPVGMTAALDARRQGIDVLVLDDDNTVSVGSRGLCYAKRTLEILDRCGVGQAVVDKGVTWNVGRTFFGEDEVFSFNLLPQPEHQRPGMVNLQQYYLEAFQVEACARDGVEIRWKNKVVSVTPGAHGVELQVDTPDGRYTLQADWLIACDGARSPVRHMLGLDMDGRVFQDRFLIADVVMKAPFPAERWFWFDPPFHPNQSVLLHREADDVWRIDFQLGWDADPEAARQPEHVVPLIRAMLGEQHPFELEWVSVYTFQCRRMERFNHGRVLFAGDAAHQVSPFGARGANSGIQDSDNLLWKLKLVMDGRAPARLLDSYSDERCLAADENILNSTRSTDFITPKSAMSRTFRNAVLSLARQHPFARKLVNSGRLSVPTHYSHSGLNTPASDAFEGTMAPGAPMDDAPVEAQGQPGWLLHHLGNRFQVLVYAEGPEALNGPLLDSLQVLSQGLVPVQAVVVSPVALTPPTDGPAMSCLVDSKGLVAQRCDLRPGSALLIRPDQHVAARWRSLDAAAVQSALARATANT